MRVRWAGVAVANKHTLAVTDGGAVYSWGDNSQGQLGYGTTDSAANGNPRVVEAMKVCNIAALLAHTQLSTGSVCLKIYKEVKCGLLMSSARHLVMLPCNLMSLQGKRVTAVAAAKRHSLAHTAEGDVWTWGHCGVSPRRVQLVGVRDVQRLSGKEVLYCSASIVCCFCGVIRHRASADGAC